VHIVAPSNGRVTAHLYGPEDPWRGDGTRLTCSFTVHISAGQRAVLIELCGTRVLLEQGQWSEWVPVRFARGPALGGVSGIVRFYLKQLRPHFGLYVSPVNINPTAPAMQISSPGGFARRIAREIGLFYTKGLPAEYLARMDNVFDDDDYLAQAELVWQERLRLLDYACRHYRGGFLFVYFTLSDLNSHMFWRARDPRHPAYDEELGRRYGDVVGRTYRRLDAVVGRILDEMPRRATLLVISDHGFASLRRYFCVNAWLRQQGLYRLKDPSRRDSRTTHDVDWRHTAAFQAGYNAIYLNRKDRYARGIVNESDADAVLAKIQRGLTAAVDPTTGQRPVARAVRPEEVYEGPCLGRAPGLIVGFNSGYRASTHSITGGVAHELIADNRDSWSGTHLIDPAQVPGVLLCNRPIEARSAGMEDVGPTICRLFGLSPEGMEGRPIPGLWPRGQH